MKHILTALLMFSSAAHAACIDPPAAKVDWTGCVFPDGKDLSGLDLQLAVMPGVWLRFANLKGTNLSNANMKGANLIGANLSGANLTASLLHDAVLYTANLQGANLTGAAMIRTNVMGAKLMGAKLSRTTWTDGTRECLSTSIGACH